MKILLQINTVVNSGSTGRIAEEIGQEAIASGWKSYIAFGRNVRHSESNLIRIGGNWDVIIHGIQTRLFDNHGFASKHATLKLIKQIKEIKPDLIQLHNLHGYYINIEILFNYLSTSNIPIVWTFHDCWPITGHCVYFEEIGCTKWKQLCHQCPQLRTYPAGLFIDNSKNNFIIKKRLFNSISNLTIVTVSNWLKLITYQSFLKQQNIKMIYNGIDLKTFSPRSTEIIKKKLNIKDKFFILGVANIWSKRKGLDDFIKLSKSLSDEFQIILVGLKKSQIKNLPKNIIGFIRTENVEELAELYSLADVYINTSVEETFGLTTAEALACGTPAIVYNSTACPEVIDKETGFLVEKQNIKGILEAIHIIKKDGKSKYSQACRNRAVEYFNKNERYEQYFELYNSLLSS